jgi:hypothetical protein
MKKPHRPKGRQLRKEGPHKIELNRLLEVLSAFDRGVVEFSMGLYNVPRRERVAVRQQNRRLHRALKAYAPRLLQLPQPWFELPDPENLRPGANRGN